MYKVQDTLRIYFTNSPDRSKFHLARVPCETLILIAENSGHSVNTNSSLGHSPFLDRTSYARTSTQA